MRLLTNRLIRTKMRRIFQTLTLICTLLVLISLASKWSSKPVLNDANRVVTTINHSPVKSLPSHQVVPANVFVNPIVEKPADGRPDFPKYVHLDLKGAPPKVARFYEDFFDFIEELDMGVKGVLIEYEDMLPLVGRLQNATHRVGYTKADIESIQSSAKTHQLEVIPLIQTFGHLEWLLKLQEFELYRDDLASPMVITPCVNSSYLLLEALLQQTIDLHPNSNIIHIGCDEVILTDSHPQCRDVRMDIPERYVNHVKRVVNIVRKFRPGMRVLIWDDVIRGDQFVNNEKLLEQLKGLVEPVAWHYRPAFEESYIASPIWSIYSKLFPHTWAASAFKGGLNRLSMQTNATHHVLNNRAWLQFIESSAAGNAPFSAIILTGWSRFDHFMPLCDILPSAYESLISSLYMINTGRSIVNEFPNDCDGLMNTIGKDPQLCQSIPGLSMWSSILSLSSSVSQIEERLTFLHTVAPSYNRKHLFVRRFELDSRLVELQALQNNLLTLTQILHGHFSELYTLDVIDEWFDLYVTPILDRINATLVEFQPVRNQTAWPRRPLI